MLMDEEHIRIMQQSNEYAAIRRYRALGLACLSKEEKVKARALLRKHNIRVFKRGIIGN